MKLFDLCPDVLIDVFTRWLPFENLFAFDSSATNQSLRVRYLSLIQLDYCIFDGRSCHAGWLKWILIRGMRTSSVSLNLNTDPYDMIIEVMKRDQKSIQHFKILETNPDIDVGVTDLCSELVNLTCLEMNEANGNISKILDMIPNPELLKELILCPVTPHSLSTASSRCINLEKLDFHSKNIESLDFDCQFPKVRDLTLDCRFEMTEKVIKACKFVTELNVVLVSSRIYSSLQCLTELEELTFISYDRENDSNIVNILSNSKKLVALTVHFYPSEFVVAAVTQHCTSFKMLKVNCDIMLSNEVLTNFVNKFSTLTKLSLSNSSVNKQFVEALSRNCLNLEELILLHDVTFTDEFVMMVTRGCVYLKKLTLPRCLQLTDKSILHICANCDHLVTLSVCVSEMAMGVFKPFAFSCPHLQSVDMYSKRTEPREACVWLSELRKGLYFRSH